MLCPHRPSISVVLGLPPRVEHMCDDCHVRPVSPLHPNPPCTASPARTAVHTHRRGPREDTQSQVRLHFCAPVRLQRHSYSDGPDPRRIPALLRPAHAHAQAPILGSEAGPFRCSTIKSGKVTWRLGFSAPSQWRRRFFMHRASLTTSARPSWQDSIDRH